MSKESHNKLDLKAIYYELHYSGVFFYHKI